MYSNIYQIDIKSPGMFSVPDLEPDRIVSTTVELLGLFGHREAFTEIKTFFLEDPTWSMSFLIRAAMTDLTLERDLRNLHVQISNLGRQKYVR